MLLRVPRMAVLAGLRVAGKPERSHELTSLAQARYH